MQQLSQRNQYQITKIRRRPTLFLLSLSQRSTQHIQSGSRIITIPHQIIKHSHLIQLQIESHLKLLSVQHESDGFIQHDTDVQAGDTRAVLKPNISENINSELTASINNQKHHTRFHENICCSKSIAFAEIRLRLRRHVQIGFVSGMTFGLHKTYRKTGRKNSILLSLILRSG